jgi:hypothetical protein
MIVNDVLQAVQKIYQVDGTEEEIVDTVSMLQKNFSMQILSI